MRFYAGIGSRKTPPDVRLSMTEIARALYTNGDWLRTGGASGADAAFLAGTKLAQVFLPWEGFNGIKYGCAFKSPWAEEVAKHFHPNWSALSPGGRKLMTRNTCQVLGRHAEDVNSSFVVCWTPDGQASGGTGQAIRIAEAFEIEVFNLHKQGTFQEVIRLANR